MSTGDDFYDSNEYDDGYAESDILQPTYDWNGVEISPKQGRIIHETTILSPRADISPHQQNSHSSLAKKGRAWKKFYKTFREVRFASTSSVYGRSNPGDFQKPSWHCRCDFSSHRCPPPDLDTLCSITKFSKKEIQHMYRAFKQECPSGVISEGIFRLLLASLFPNGDTALYAHLVFRAFDARDVGYLVFEDFASMMSTICRGSQGDKLQFVFRMYDIDGNGAIDKDELFQIITAVHKLVLPKKSSSSSNLLHHHLVERHVERIWKRLDVEDNGFITQDDFVQGCLSEPAIVESLASLQDPENYKDLPGPSCSPELTTDIE